MAAKTIDEVIASLEKIIAESIANENRLGYFAALYKRVTEAVKKGIADGVFMDGPAMEKLDVTFANRYLHAYETYMSKGSPSISWQLAFDAAQRRPTLVIQHLFVGMNAHISLDLGIAAYEAYGSDLERLKPDFMKINEVLMSLVGTVQKELASFWSFMKIIDWVGGKMDEELAGFAMDYARDKAWAFALALKDAAGSVEKVISDRDKKVAVFGEKLVSPGLILSIVILALKLFEHGSTSSKIKLLNTV